MIIRKTNDSQPELIDLFDDREELFDIHGFNDICVRTKTVRREHVWFVVRSCQHNNWDRLEVPIRSHCFQNFATVHARHVQVQENQVRTWDTRIIAFVPQKLHRFDAISNVMDAVIKFTLLQGPHREISIGRTVFDEKNLHRSCSVIHDDLAR